MQTRVWRYGGIMSDFISPLFIYLIYRRPILFRWFSFPAAIASQKLKRSVVCNYRSSFLQQKTLLLKRLVSSLTSYRVTLWHHTTSPCHTVAYNVRLDFTQLLCCCKQCWARHQSEETGYLFYQSQNNTWKRRKVSFNDDAYHVEINWKTSS